jgi:AmmeMemoRadiSam system radical SAM enzyme
MSCRSIAYTYNDPVIFLEYAIDVAAACRARNIRNVAVSAGYMGDGARGEFYGAMDAVNIDLKAFTERFYQRLCSGQLEPVLETLVYLKQETEVWFEVTTLLIPGENDGIEEVERLAAWFLEHLGPDVPLHFTAFHPDWKMLETPPTPPATLLRGRSRARTGAQLCLLGQHPRRGKSDDVLPGLRGESHRTRLVRAHPLGAHRRRALPGLRHALPWPLRRAGRPPGTHLGPPPGAAQGRDRRVTRA